MWCSFDSPFPLLRSNSGEARFADVLLYCQETDGFGHNQSNQCCLLFPFASSTSCFGGLTLVLCPPFFFFFLLFRPSTVLSISSLVHRQTKLRGLQYPTLHAFATDVRQVWLNCLLYNDPNSQVADFALEMQDWFETVRLCWYGVAFIAFFFFSSCFFFFFDRRKLDG